MRSPGIRISKDILSPLDLNIRYLLIKLLPIVVSYNTGGNRFFNWVESDRAGAVAILGG